MLMMNEKKDYAFAGKFILNKGIQTISYNALTTAHKRFIEEDLATIMGLIYVT
jgi:hypothetical protein